MSKDEDKEGNRSGNRPIDLSRDIEELQDVAVKLCGRVQELWLSNDYLVLRPISPITTEAEIGEVVGSARREFKKGDTLLYLTIESDSVRYIKLEEDVLVLKATLVIGKING